MLTKYSTDLHKSHCIAQKLFDDSIGILVNCTVSVHSLEVGSSPVCNKFSLDFPWRYDFPHRGSFSY